MFLFENLGEGRRLSICLVSVGYSGAVLPLYQKLIKAVHLSEINYCKLSIMYIHHLCFSNDKLKKILASDKFIFCLI